MKQPYQYRCIAVAGACIAVACAASSVRADAAGANASSNQRADPVIEEPLRPLLPDGQAVEPVAPASCGTSDIVPLAAFSFLGFQFVSRKTRRGHRPPTNRPGPTPCP